MVEDDFELGLVASVSGRELVVEIEAVAGQEPVVEVEAGHELVIGVCMVVEVSSSAELSSPSVVRTSLRKSDINKLGESVVTLPST